MLVGGADSGQMIRDLESGVGYHLLISHRGRIKLIS